VPYSLPGAPRGPPPPWQEAAEHDPGPFQASPSAAPPTRARAGGEGGPPPHRPASTARRTRAAQRIVTGPPPARGRGGRARHPQRCSAAFNLPPPPSPTLPGHAKPRRGRSRPPGPALPSANRERLPPPSAHGELEAGIDPHGGVVRAGGDAGRPL